MGHVPDALVDQEGNRPGHLAHVRQRLARLVARVPATPGYRGRGAPRRADIASSEVLLRGLRRAVGWPARRVLDRRVRWAVDEIDDRLGSGHGAREPVRARFDQLPPEHRDFDPALALSAVEHFGLGHYGEGAPVPGVALAIAERPGA